MSDSARSLYAAIAQIAYPAHPEIAARHDTRPNECDSGKHTRHRDLLYPAMNKSIPGVLGYADEPDFKRRNAHNDPIIAADDLNWVRARRKLEDMLREGSAVAYSKAGKVPTDFWVANDLMEQHVQLFRFALASPVPKQLMLRETAFDSRPLPKRPGIKPSLRDSIVARMIQDYCRRPDALEAELQKELQSRYKASRDTCRRAMHLALDQIRQTSTIDK